MKLTPSLTASSLVRPFSLFSFFRTPSPALPQQATFQPLPEVSLDGADEKKKAIKALIGLQSYAQQAKDYFETRRPGDLTEAEEECLRSLLEAFLRAFFIASLQVWTDEEVEEDQDTIDIRQTMEGSIQGAFQLRSGLRDMTNLDVKTQQIVEEMDHNLTASVFDPSTESIHTAQHHITLLTPLFVRPRKIIESLLQASRTFAHSKVKPSSPAPTLTVTIEDAFDIISLLETFADNMSSVEALKGPKQARTKAQKEDEKRRPLRIEIEARLMGCDVAQSMANGDIKGIKSRALMKLPDQAKVEDEEEDKKGEVTKVDDMEEQTRSSPAVESNEEEDAVEWENIAESALIRCLETARTLLEAHRGPVLSNRVQRADWLGTEISPPSPKPTKDNTPASDASEFGSDFESSSEEELEEELYACPLRTLFRLHDRYEEQRLAIWLSLPTGRRGGMGTYMRGEEGKVGEAWDALGLLLLLDHDG